MEVTVLLWICYCTILYVGIAALMGVKLTPNKTNVSLLQEPRLYKFSELVGQSLLVFRQVKYCNTLLSKWWCKQTADRTKWLASFYKVNKSKLHASYRVTITWAVWHLSISLMLVVQYTRTRHKSECQILRIELQHFCYSNFSCFLPSYLISRADGIVFMCFIAYWG